MLETLVTSFLDTHYDAKQPVLLGLSGGPDSLALLYLLLNYKKHMPLHLGVAHIDHGWREESTEEASQLQKMAEALNLPFHLKKLRPEDLTGNLEAACRQERLSFFSQLCKQHNYQAVFLGHHSDDQVETVLKRVFEGADLTRLAGLQPLAIVDNLNLWRPLLLISKSDIESWLMNRGLSAFLDKTNQDPRFLRARLRTQLIPHLSQTFGKEIKRSLYNLGEESKELHAFLLESLGPVFKSVERGPIGVMLDLNQHPDLLPYAIKFVVREVCRQEGAVLSKELLNNILMMVVTGQGNKQAVIGNQQIYIDRKRLFILRGPLAELPQSELLLQEGRHIYGSWQVTVESIIQPMSQQSGWKSAWRGSLEICLPVGDYYLAPAKLSAPYPKQNASINKWWTNEKVPAFLRHFLPVIWHQDRIIFEFLSSRYFLKNSADAEQDWLKIKFSYMQDLNYALYK